MAEYVVVDKEQLETDLTVVADAIREKGGTSEQLAFPNGMKEAVEAIQSGGGVDLYEHATSMQYHFRDAMFPENTELNLNLPNLSVSIEGAFQRVSGVKKITLKGNNDGNAFSWSSCFWDASAETIDLTNIKVIPSMANGMFRCSMVANAVLKYIYGEIDFSNCRTANSMAVPFLNNVKLEYIRIKKESIFVNFSISSTGVLTAESIQSIIDGLADLTGGTAQTISFHSTVKEKLTDEQKAQITSKNWILA